MHHSNTTQVSGVESKPIKNVNTVPFFQSLISRPNERESRPWHHYPAVKLVEGTHKINTGTFFEVWVFGQIWKNPFHDISTKLQNCLARWNKFSIKACFTHFLIIPIFKCCGISVNVIEYKYKIGHECQRWDLRVEVQRTQPRALADDSMPLILLA